MLAALLAGASLWQLSKSTASDYITGLAFPLVLKTYLVATIAMAVVFVVLDLTGLWSIQIMWYGALQVIIICLTAWKLLAIGAAQDAIRDVGEQVQAKVSNWKLLQADVDAILQTAPAGLQRDISAVRDAMCS